LKAASILAGAALSVEEARAAPAYPVVELRQYTLHEGKRDVLIDLFERNFIEPQEAEGMKIIGTFRDLDHPNRFVWLRGFTDMKKRVSGLTNFYGGPVWKGHREAANATMIDSDNVLLLHAPSDAAGFEPMARRPELREARPRGLIIATIYPLRSSPEEARELFEDKVKPRLSTAGVHVLAWFIPETAANNFPRLPVREGERVLVWFARFEDEADRLAHLNVVSSATKALDPLVEGEPQVLRLQPTERSELR
jgi:quinol monooxygenase YgiN